MPDFTLPDDLVDRTADTHIMLVVMDGVGGLPRPSDGLTELEAAATPHLDALAGHASLGMLAPVGPGITPGSGPGHLSLFGYDPVRHRIGRGTLSALGVGFDLEPGNVAARLNLATFDADGNVVDRRAGRPSDEEGRRIVEKVRAALRVPAGVTVHLIPEKEHRVALILQGEGLHAGLADTDPQETGVPPLPVRATDSEAARTAEVVRDVLEQARAALADEPTAHGFLARGFDQYQGFPGFEARFGLHAVAIAKYPMYRGVARLVGMTVDGIPGDDEETVALAEAYRDRYDFTFLHFKAPDARGEDGDFGAKVAAIEAIDALVPRLRALEPDVLVVTGDHSTPATYRAHSWHHVPVLLASRWSRPTASEFGESACRSGDLGMFAGKHLMALALAHADRLAKYGA